MTDRQAPTTARRALRLARAALPSLALPLGLGACAGAIEMLELKPTARVADARFTSLSLTGLSLAVDVEVTNTFPVPLPLLDLDWALATDGQPFLRGSTELGGDVPASGRRTVTLPVEVRFAELLTAITTAHAGETMPYAVDLGLSLDLPGSGTTRIPLRHTGTLPVPAAPRINVVSVDLEELSLQNARGVARIEVANANSFPLSLEAFSYGLTLGGARVADGRATAPHVFEPGVAIPLEIPLDVSPISLGAALFESLTRGRARYTLGGALEVGTPFGDMEMAFESGGETNVAR